MWKYEICQRFSEGFQVQSVHVNTGAKMDGQLWIFVFKQR